MPVRYLVVGNVKLNNQYTKEAPHRGANIKKGLVVPNLLYRHNAIDKYRLKILS